MHALFAAAVVCGCCVADDYVRVQRDTMLAAAAVYEALYGDEDGVPATFQVKHYLMVCMILFYVRHHNVYVMIL